MFLKKKPQKIFPFKTTFLDFCRGECRNFLNQKNESLRIACNGEKSFFHIGRGGPSSSVYDTNNNNNDGKVTQTEFWCAVPSLFITDQHVRPFVQCEHHPPSLQKKTSKSKGTFSHLCEAHPPPPGHPLKHDVLKRRSVQSIRPNKQVNSASSFSFFPCFRTTFLSFQQTFKTTQQTYWTPSANYFESCELPKMVTKRDECNATGSRHRKEQFQWRHKWNAFLLWPILFGMINWW